MNKIILDKIVLSNQTKAEYFTTVSKDLQKFFTDQNYFLDYSESIEEVPNAILAIPWLCDILPIIWLSDSEVEIEELDIAFYNCIDEIKKGYQERYPRLSFKGKVTVKNLVDCSYDVDPNSPHGSIACFSGGVDSIATVVRHIDERPLLLSIWGSDIPLTEVDGWENLKSQMSDFGKVMGLKNTFVASGFRANVNTGVLSRWLRDELGYAKGEWWFYIQHGIAIASHMTPMAYKYKISQCYLSGDSGNSASNPILVEPIKFGKSEFKVTLTEWNRVEKTALIGEYVKANPNLKGKIILHVCWQTTTGDNCSKCIKCLRTIMTMKSLQINLEDFGFVEYPNIYLDFYDKIKNGVERCIVYLWNEVRDAFNKHRQLWENDPDVSWILDFDFEKQEEINKERDEANRKHAEINRKLDEMDKRYIRIKNKIKKLIPAPIKTIIKKLLGR